VTSFVERVVSEKAADGVWFLSGGSHNSALIEMADHLILVESPLYDGRAQAVMAEARKLAPGKPIRYVVNSHHHFDHSGGLRTAAAEGASLVGVNGRRTFSDGSRTVEILMVENSVHAQGFMMVWLPRERILVEADAYTPGPPGTPAPAQPNANNVNLAQNIERL